MSDTIAAIATGGVISAIGIIRISGDDAISVAEKVFRAASGTRLSNAQNRRMYYGELLGVDGDLPGTADENLPTADENQSGAADENLPTADENLPVAADGDLPGAAGKRPDAHGKLIDLCLCTISRGPESYTGEDTVEFHCHGSPVVLAEVLRLLFSHGVRQAQAGEFTKRAFLNGRMDLTQAEAVIDLIEAVSPASALNAACQLRGAVGVKLGAVYNSLVDVMAHFHAVVDYPDEDIDEFEMMGYLSALCASEEELSRLLATHERGRVLREGVPTAIIGRPNTGKSSLLNALLGYDRAIVTSISGTTRDTIEEKVFFGGVLLRLIDTAGLRKTDDTLEKLGVGRTLAALQNAGLVLLVLDGSEPLNDEDFEALRRIPREAAALAVVNKSDLPAVLGRQELSAFLGQREPSASGVDYCRVSALTGNGLDVLDAEIKKMFPELNLPSSGELITNARQAEAISRARESIKLAIAAINESVTPDAVLTDIEAAIMAIGEVTGKTMREDIVTRIFSRFCVGK